MQKTSLAQSTLFAEDSLAKEFRPQANTRGLRTSGPDSGVSSLVLLAKYDPLTRLWKTLVPSRATGSAAFSETWPRSGSMRSGIAYQRPPLAHVTAETEHGSWPTPKAREDGRTPEAWEKARMRGYEVRKAKGISPGGPASSRGSLSVAVQIAEGRHGKLNPEWREWLMGFPIGWTEPG
jgi:hypothetical protein